MCSQETRGGGALCTKNSRLWAAFNSSIVSVESCYQYDPCLGTSTQCYWCPTKAPTVKPTPSASPTLSLPPSQNPQSSNLPTQLQVTYMPTSLSGQPATSLSFISSFALLNVSVAAFNSAAQQAMIITAAQVMGVPSTDVTFSNAVAGVASAVADVSLGATSAKPALTVNLQTVIVFSTNSPFASFSSNPNALYNQLTAKLVTSVESQNFTSQLQKTSKQLGATSTMSASVSSVVNTAPTVGTASAPSPVNPSNGGSLGVGVIVGIVIASIFILAATAFISYVRYLRKTKLALEEQFAVDVVYEKKAKSSRGTSVENITSSSYAWTSSPLIRISEGTISGINDDSSVKKVVSGSLL